MQGKGAEVSTGAWGAVVVAVLACVADLSGQATRGGQAAGRCRPQAGWALTVGMAMKMIAMRSVVLRPYVSPMWPKMRAPRGRTTKPTA